MEFKRLGLTSAVPSDFTLEALRQVIPSAFTEVRGEDGQLTHKVDFERLRELLGDAIADADEERYGFYWVGKQEAKRAAAQPTRQTLRPVEEESVAWESTQNLYIEGDNLEVLKLLQTAYIGKVKMIYIDPPYNTGKDKIYTDNFMMSREEQDEAMGNLDEEGNRLRRNLDSNPRYHSDWCSMIYSRLLVARTLLSNDGVIFISIDDNEVHNLRKICDEVFGADNIISEVVVNRTSEVATNMTVQKHEYCLVYAKNIAETKLCGNKKATISRGTVGNLDQTTPIITFPAGLACKNIPDGTYTSSRQIKDGKENIEVISPFIVENGILKEEVQLRARWRSSNDMRNFFANSCLPTPAKINGIIVEIYFDGDRFMPYIKKVVTEKIPTLYLDNRRGSKDLERLGITGFDFPKAVSLLKFFTSLYTDKDSLILDFFSGSATTAHAVMQLNAEDGGKRKYICVQLQEDLIESLKKATGSERKTIENAISFLKGIGKPCLLTEIGKERIRRAGRQIKEGPGLRGDDLDIGFRVLRLDSSNMEEVYFEPGNVSQASLFSQVDSVKRDRTPLDLLFGCMVDWGVELSLPIRREEVGGKELFVVNDGALIACFEEEIPLETIRYIAGLSPQRLIFRESSFATDADKLNVYEQFKQLCSWSEEESYRNIRVI